MNISWISWVQDIPCEAAEDQSIWLYSHFYWRDPGTCNSASAFDTMKDAWRMAERLNGYPGPSWYCCCFSAGTSKACHDHYIADAQWPKLGENRPQWSWLLVFSEMQSNQHYPASPPEFSKVYRGQEPERLYPGLFQLFHIWSHNAFLDFLLAPEQMEGMDSRSS